MNERLSTILKHPYTIPVTTGVISFIAGAAVGYALGRRQKPIEYEQVIKVEDIPRTRLIIDAEDLKQRDLNDESTSHPLTEEVLKGPELTLVEEDEVVPEPEPRNIFAQTVEGWDYEAELAKRSPDRPYILHKDEFFADENDWTQSQLRWFEGDGFLVDEDDSPIYNHHEVVGELRFGHGSGEPDIVYIRNERRRGEYEVIRTDGLYSEEILGLSIEDNVRAKDARRAREQRMNQEE